MDAPAHTLAASTLQTLLFLGRIEEKRPRGILADGPKFMVKMKTQSELEKVLKRIKVQFEELERLHAEPRQDGM